MTKQTKQAKQAKQAPGLDPATKALLDTALGKTHLHETHSALAVGMVAAIKVAAAARNAGLSLAISGISAVGTATTVGVMDERMSAAERQAVTQHKRESFLARLDGETPMTRAQAFAALTVMTKILTAAKDTVEQSLLDHGEVEVPAAILLLELQTELEADMAAGTDLDDAMASALEKMAERGLRIDPGASEQSAEDAASSLVRQIAKRATERRAREQQGATLSPTGLADALGELEHPELDPFTPDPDVDPYAPYWIDGNSP